MRYRLTILAFAASLALALPAGAEPSPTDVAASTLLFNQGRTLMAAGKYTEAAEKFSAANALSPGVGILLNLGECNEKAGRLASAYGAYTEAMILGRRLGDQDRANEGKRRADALEPRLARLRFDVPAESRGAGITIQQDGHGIPETAWTAGIPVDAGEHTVEVAAPGKRAWKTVIRVGTEAGTTPVSIPALSPDASAGSAADSGGAQRTAGIAVGAAGLAGIIVGSALGGVAIAKKNASNADGHCTGDFCDQTGKDLRSASIHAGNGSTAAFAVGGAALAAGIIVFFTAPKAPVKSASAGLVAGPGSLGVAGRW